MLVKESLIQAFDYRFQAVKNLCIVGKLIGFASSDGKREFKHGLVSVLVWGSGTALPKILVLAYLSNICRKFPALRFYKSLKLPAVVVQYRPMAEAEESWL